MFAGIYASLKPGGSCACIQWNSSTWSQAAIWCFSIPRALLEFVVWEGDRVPLQSFKYCTKPMSRADSHPSDDARPFFSWRPCGSPSSRCFCSLPAAWRSRFHWNWCCLEAKRLVCDWRKAARVIHYIAPAEKKCAQSLCASENLGWQGNGHTWLGQLRQKKKLSAGGWCPGDLWPGEHQGEAWDWAIWFKVNQSTKKVGNLC